MTRPKRVRPSSVDGQRRGATRRSRSIPVRPEVGSDRKAQLRLEREARALAKVSHPNIVAIHEVGEHQGQLFLAMEHVQGQSLRAWQERESRSRSAVLAMYMQAGRGLAAAHAAGLVDFARFGLRHRPSSSPLRRSLGLRRPGGFDSALLSTSSARSPAASTPAAARARRPAHAPPSPALLPRPSPSPARASAPPHRP